MLFIPEFFLILIAIVIVFSKNFIRRDDWVPIVTLTSFGVAFLWRIGIIGQIGWFGDFFLLNNFSAYFDLIYLFVVFCAVILSFAIQKDRNIYYALLIIATVGMMLLTKAQDILALFLSIELIALSLYSLVIFGKEDAKLEGGVKYFVLNIFASAMLVLGFGIIFSLSQATKFKEIGQVLGSADPLMVLAGIIFIIAGLGFKMGVFPFNFWLPDVYESAPIGITAVLAGASKKAAFGAILLLMVLCFSSITPFWSGIFVLLSVATLLFGHLSAIWQSNIRRFVAYSIIGQSGFIMIGLAVPSTLGITGLLFHILTHALAVIGIFAIISYLETKKIYEIHALSGLGKRNVFLAISLAVLLASLGGVPLLAGFVSKFILISAAIEGGQIMLAVFAVFSSVISIYFYFKVILSIFAGAKQGKDLTTPMNIGILLTVILIFIFIFGIMPNGLLIFLNDIGNNLIR